jgi:hypothetical protein
MIDAVKTAPSGSYIRLLGFLWEKANKRHLDPLPDISGPTINCLMNGVTSQLKGFAMHAGASTSTASGHWITVLRSKERQ